MPVVTLTTTNASPQTWTVPADAPVSTALTVECWGAGSGGSGSSTSFRAGGAGGAWSKSTYIVTPDNVTNGISYTLQAGTAGTGAANSTVGPDTSFSTNNLNIVPNGTMNGAVVGTPGTLPTGWSYTNNVAISTEIVGFGLDVPSGLQYIDIRIFGTPNASNVWTVNFGPGTTPVTSSTTYAASGYFQLVGGSTTNITFQELDLINNGTFGAICSGSFTPTTTLTRTAASGASGTATQAFLRIQLGFTSGSAIDQTIRIAGVQTEIGSSATAWKSTPGYTLAKGGGATSGTTGGVGGATATSIGSVATNAGGGGASRTSGGGGGGGAGKDGGGTTATTGTGGTGDAGSGGAAGVANIEGGGGASASATPSAAGDPGGGGGGNTSTGNGSAGGRGQIRITYSSSLIIPQLNPKIEAVQQLLAMMAQ